MNDCGDCVQTAASGEVGGRLLRSLMIFGNSPVIAEPSHKGPRFGLRIAIILTTISHRLHILIEGKDYNPEMLKILVKFGADINFYKHTLKQIKIEIPESALEIQDPREPGYHSGLKTIALELTPLHCAIQKNNISE